MPQGNCVGVGVAVCSLPLLLCEHMWTAELPADLIQMQFCSQGDNLRFAPFNPISAKVPSQY